MIVPFLLRHIRLFNRSNNFICFLFNRTSLQIPKRVGYDKHTWVEYAAIYQSTSLVHLQIESWRPSSSGSAKPRHSSYHCTTHPRVIRVSGSTRTEINGWWIISTGLIKSMVQVWCRVFLATIAEALKYQFHSEIQRQQQIQWFGSSICLKH